VLLIKKKKTNGKTHLNLWSKLKKKMVFLDLELLKMMMENKFQKMQRALKIAMKMVFA
jgi:hypothetical protein